MNSMCTCPGLQYRQIIEGFTKRNQDKPYFHGPVMLHMASPLLKFLEMTDCTLRLAMKHSKKQIQAEKEGYEKSHGLARHLQQKGFLIFVFFSDGNSHLIR